MNNIVQKFVKLHAVKFGLACGIVSGICIALTTLAGISGFLGGFPLWNALILDIYGRFGYSLSLPGVLIGAVYGFIDAFIATWVFALVYNKLL